MGTWPTSDHLAHEPTATRTWRNRQPNGKTGRNSDREILHLDLRALRSRQRYGAPGTDYDQLLVPPKRLRSIRLLQNAGLLPMAGADSNVTGSGPAAATSVLVAGWIGVPAYSAPTAPRFGRNRLARHSHEPGWMGRRVSVQGGFPRKDLGSVMSMSKGHSVASGVNCLRAHISGLKRDDERAKGMTDNSRPD